METKLTAHQIFKLKIEKNLSDYDYKKLLIENEIIVCERCMGTGKIIQGGSFGGEVHEITCDCKNIFKTN